MPQNRKKVGIPLRTRVTTPDLHGIPSADEHADERFCEEAAAKVLLLMRGVDMSHQMEVSCSIQQWGGGKRYLYIFMLVNIEACSSAVEGKHSRYPFNRLRSTTHKSSHQKSFSG